MADPRKQARPPSRVLPIAALLCATLGVSPSRADAPPWDESWRADFTSAGDGKSCFGRSADTDGETTGTDLNLGFAQASSTVDAFPFLAGSSSHGVTFRRKFTLPAGGPYSLSLWARVDGSAASFTSSASASMAVFGGIRPDGGGANLVVLNPTDNPNFSINVTASASTASPAGGWTALEVTPVTVAAGTYEVTGVLSTDAFTSDGSVGADAESLFAPGFRLLAEYETVRDEVLVFDSTEAASGMSEGLIRQRLGLLDADGRPQLDANGHPVALVSADGRKKGFDLQGGSLYELRQAIAAVKGNGGTLTIMLHGSVGSIQIEGRSWAGFGDGTGKACAGEPYKLDGIGAKTNLTIHLSACRAKATATGVSAVSESLRAEIQRLGGTVAVLNASTPNTQGTIVASARVKPGVSVTATDLANAKNAVSVLKLNKLFFANHHRGLQLALDELAAGKFIAMVRYELDLDGTIVRLVDPLGDVEPEVHTVMPCADCGDATPLGCDVDRDDRLDRDDGDRLVAALGASDGDPTFDAAVDFDHDREITDADYAAWLGCFAAPPEGERHWACYKAKTASGTPRQPRLDDEPVEDAIGYALADLKKTDSICLPTDKNGEDPEAPTRAEHLRGYKVSAPKPAPNGEHVVTNQFGEVVVTLIRPGRILVPAAKSRTSPPAPPTTPGDPFTCYKAKVATGQPKFVAIPNVSLADQFGTTVVDVKKPTKLCLPAVLAFDDPDRLDHAGVLMCYQVKRATNAIAVGRVNPVYVADAFGSETLEAVKLQELCVPSRLDVPPVGP